ncbi:MAG: 3-deoxy-8-phosphooctulonate synthase [Bacteroidota bacterium]
MSRFDNPVRLTNSIRLGDEKMVLFAGPCAAEGYDLCMEVGEVISTLCEQLDINYVFKASFDKANRTAATSYRGGGMDRGLEILAFVKDKLHVPVVTDIHESNQAQKVAEVADVLQIPAYLCRQTDLLLAAGETGKAVKVKRGQFMAPEDMKYAIEKVRSTGNENVFLTERGASFGYHNLVVDMRSLPIMRQFCPVVFDITHSVQQPGGAGGSSGGQREFAPYLARAAAASGVDGFFVETHPHPERALSDGPNMIPLDDMPGLLKMLKDVWQVGRAYVT